MQTKTWRGGKQSDALHIAFFRRQQQPCFDLVVGGRGILISREREIAIRSLRDFWRRGPGWTCTREGGEGVVFFFLECACGMVAVYVVGEIS